MIDFTNSIFTKHNLNDSPDYSEQENFFEPNILAANDFISTSNLKEYYKNDIFYNGEFPILKEDYIKEQSPYKTNLNNFKGFEESSILFIHDPISKKYKELNFHDIYNINKEKLNKDIFQENFHEKKQKEFEIKNENDETLGNAENVKEEIIEKDENEFINDKKELKKLKWEKKTVKKNKKKKNKIKNNNNISLNNKYKKNIFEVFNVFNPKMDNEYYKFKREKFFSNANNISEKQQIKDLINESIKNHNKKIDNISSNLLTENDKNIKKKRQRKDKPDDVRKKIKARFLKSLKNTINNKLKCANSEKLFNFLPQCFICAITKKRNDLSVLNMTFKELMSTNFYEEYNNETNTNNLLKKKRSLSSTDINNLLKKENILYNQDPKNYKNPHKKVKMNPDKKKYLANLEVLNYLENKKEISNKVNFDIIQNMTFSDLYNEYLKSKEFQEDILKSKKEEKESEDYINDYIVKANDYIKYFSNLG